MGPCCKICNNRCFVHMPEGTPQEALDAYGINTIVATCQGGQAFELKKIGWNYDKISEAAMWAVYQSEDIDPRKQEF